MASRNGRARSCVTAVDRAATADNVMGDHDSDSTPITETPRRNVAETLDTERKIEPVTCYRVTLPNGVEQLVEQPSCQHCQPRVVEIPRRTASALVIWDCGGGCGWHPVTGEMVGGAV